MLKAEIKPKEIRLGNLFYYRDSDSPLVAEVSEISYANVDIDILSELPEGLSQYQPQVAYCWLEPIPITDWPLNKLCFFPYDGVKNSYIDGLCRFVLTMEGRGIWSLHSYNVVDGEMQLIKDIKYLHELQNIIHSLTGEELTINL